MIDIREELPGDIPAREALLDRCFGGSRHRKTVAKLRRGRLPAEGLALSAHHGGTLVGTVRLWDVAAGSAGAALLLGPIAIAPELQGQGLGQAMMRWTLAQAQLRGHRSIILVGDAPYYARFGFSRGPVQGLVLPGPVEIERFLGLELVPGALTGAEGRIAATGRKVPRPAIAA